MSDLPPTRQPYRDAVVVHGVLSALIVLVAALSGGELGKAVLVAVAYFVIATAWTWGRFRQRERRAERQAPGGGRG